MTQVLLLTFLTVTSVVQAISSPWRPIVPSILPGSSSSSVLPVHTSTSIVHQEGSIYSNPAIQSPFEVQSSDLLLQQNQDQCPLYKISMSQQLYFEYIHYKTDLPDMKEFTLCMWTKFHNHSNDHPLFSYAAGEQPRGILAWVANTPRSSYYMMNVDGHNLYRLNYPLRLNKWYHSCQSWNGRTGEWQIWVNDERVGRGFNNRLVGHVVKGGGIAISGQEQRQLGGGFLEGEGAPQGSGGMLGEITMLQLYGIALSAGKAHKDHKHHHAHHYEHETNNNTPLTTTRRPVSGPPLPQNPFLTGGQINHQVKINPGAPAQVVQNGVTIRHPALPAPQEPAPQPFPPVNPDSIPTAFPALQTYSNEFQSSQFFSSPAETLPTNEGVSFVDGPYRNLFKREKDSSKRESSEEMVTDVETENSAKHVVKRQAEKIDEVDDTVAFEPVRPVAHDRNLNKRESDKKKRGLLQLTDGLILHEEYTVPQGLDNNFFSGLASFGQLPQHDTKDEEREPAEAEVKFIMDICDGCAQEPFEKALIFGWRSVPKKIYSGALYLPAVPACKAF